LEKRIRQKSIGRQSYCRPVWSSRELDDGGIALPDALIGVRMASMMTGVSIRTPVPCKWLQGDSTTLGEADLSIDAQSHVYNLLPATYAPDMQYNNASFHHG
jgi:hypothetical protein